MCDFLSSDVGFDGQWKAMVTQGNVYFWGKVCHWADASPVSGEAEVCGGPSEEENAFTE